VWTVRHGGEFPIVTPINFLLRDRPAVDASGLISHIRKDIVGSNPTLRNQFQSGVDVMVASQFSKLLVSVRVRDAAPI
jgi:hypothetical protein